MVHTQNVSIESGGGFSVIPVTGQVEEVLLSSGIQQGVVHLLYQHTTGALLVGEYEPGILADLQDLLESIAPLGGAYHHHLRGVDQNGAAHVRSLLLGVSLSLPISQGRLLLGEFQEILVLDLQTEHRPRGLVVQVIGD